MTILGLVTVICLFAYEMQVQTAWVLFFILPIAVLPFTYVSTFLFTDDSVAQSFTMFVHFLMVGILSLLVATFRYSDSNQALFGDLLNFLLKLFPSYPLASAIYCDAQCANIYEQRIDSRY